MQRTITARYDTREQADEAREALIRIGIPAREIRIREPVLQAGMFDHLARFIAPDHAGDTQGQAYHLSAGLPAERAAQARLLLGKAATSGTGAATGISEQIFEFAETREELRVEKRPFVQEEVVVRKEAVVQVADVESTVRHTEVEVEEIPPPEASASEPLRFGLRTRPE